MQAVQNNISSKKIKPRRNVAWITSEIRKLFRKRKRLWRKAKATQLPKHKQLRNETKSALNKSYWSHVHDLIDSKNPKRFWSFIKTKTKSKSIPPVVKFQNERASTASDKAELFNNFFLSQYFHLSQNFLLMIMFTTHIPVKPFKILAVLKQMLRNCCWV